MDRVRRNLIIGVVHETVWGVGFAMMDPLTVLQLALKDLGGQAALAGLLGGLLFAGMNLAQLPAAFWLHPRFSDPRRCATLHLPALACTAGLAVLFSLGLPQPVLLKAYLVLAGAFFLLIGPVIPFWITMISRCVPEGVRGRYFAWCFALANLGGIASGALAVRWIGAGGLDWGYAACFAAALGLQIVSIGLLLLLEPLEPAAGAPGRLGPWLKEQLSLLSANRGFRLFVAAMVLMQLASAPFSLYTEHLKERGLDTAWWTWLNAAKAIGGLVGSYLMGTLADRRGPRASLMLAFALMAASLLLIPLPGASTAMGAFFGGGFFVMAYPIINLYMIIRLAGPGQTSALSGVFAALSVPFVLLSPVASGWLAQNLGYATAFAVSLAACGAGLLFLWRQPAFGVKEAAA